MPTYTRFLAAIAGLIFGVLSLCFDVIAEHLVPRRSPLILNFRLSRLWLGLKARLGALASHFAHFVYFTSNAVEVTMTVGACRGPFCVGMLHLFFL